MKVSALPLLLACSLFALPASAEDALIFHIIRSPGINWSSPRTLVRSTIKHRNRAHPIGHMTVEVRCGKKSFKSGMVQKHSGESSNVIRNRHYGLGVLFHSFKGKIQNDADVNQSLKKMLNSGRLGVIRFLISPESCQRMVEFHETYRAEEMYQHYGTLSRSMKGEGGGCSAYSMAYANVGGFQEPWMIQKWARYHRVSRRWVGGPLTNYRIKLMKLYRKAPQGWPKESSTGFPFLLYDPDKVFRWTKATHQELMNSRAVLPDPIQARVIPVTTELLGIPVAGTPKAFAIEIDQRTKLPPAVPNYSTEAADPRVALDEPDLLETWWEEEIRILRGANPSLE